MEQNLRQIVLQPTSLELRLRSTFDIRVYADSRFRYVET